MFNFTVVMKKTELFLEKLNGLLMMNYEAEKIYAELVDGIKDYELKTFFKTKGLDYMQFGKELKLEIIKLGGTPELFGDLSPDFYKYWMNFRNFILLDDEKDILHEVYNLESLMAKRYNELLREISLPLSTCKLLAKHKDVIQSGIGIIIRQEAEVA